MNTVEVRYEQQFLGPNSIINADFIIIRRPIVAHYLVIVDNEMSAVRLAVIHTHPIDTMVATGQLRKTGDTPPTLLVQFFYIGDGLALAKKVLKRALTLLGYKTKFVV